MATSHVLTVSSGNGQTGIAGQVFSSPLVVLAAFTGTPQSGIVVTFSDNGAGGSFSVNPVTSNGSGLASTLYTPPKSPGPYTITFTAPSPYFPAGPIFVLNGAVNINGKPVAVNSSCSIVAKVVSVSGSGSLAAVTVQAPLDAGTFSIQANDCYATQHEADANHPAVSLDGKYYGAVNDDVTVLGLVTSVSGIGVNAIATVTLNSQIVITTASGNCQMSS